MFTESLKQQNWDKVHQDDLTAYLKDCMMNTSHCKNFPGRNQKINHGGQKNFIKCTKPEMKIEKK